MRLRSLYLQLPLYMSYNLLFMSSSRIPYYRHEANMCDSLHLMKFILESSLVFCHYFSQFLVVFQMTCSECHCKGTVWSSLDNLVWVSSSLPSDPRSLLFIVLFPLILITIVILCSLIRYGSYQCLDLCSLSNQRTDQASLVYIASDVWQDILPQHQFDLLGYS